MNPTNPDLEASVDLARAAPFCLGPLEIAPSTREVRHGARVVVAEPRALQVLTALHQAGGAVVSRDTLVRRCWDGRIVGEDAINRSIAKARQLAELADPPAFVIETIPRVGYRLKTTEAAPAPAGIVPPVSAVGAPSRRTLALAGAGVIAAGAAGVTGLWLSPRARTPAKMPLVAVLPFDNLSPDPQLGYFADGLAEDILDTLTRAGGLRVSARSSSFTFRGPAKAKAAAALGATYLLDGSVLREGTRLRVNAHLSDAGNQQTLWSQTYDHKVGQGLQIEDDIAQQVAAALKVQLSPHGARTIDPAVFDLYLKGREATRQQDPKAVAEGEALLQQVVERAPDFAEAWYQLARNRWRSAFLLPRAQQEPGFALGREAARRALALEPNYGAAYGVLAKLTPFFHHWDEIEAGLKRGLALSPADPDLIMWWGDFLLQSGRLGMAAETMRRAWTIDPLQFANNQIFYTALTAARRFPEAEAEVKRIQAIWPKQLGAYWNWFWHLAATGRELEAAAFLDDKSRRTIDELPQEFTVLAEAMRAAVSGSTERRKASARQCLDLATYGLGYATNAIWLMARLGEDETAAALAKTVYLGQGPFKIDRSIEFRSNSRFPPFGEESVQKLFHPMLARVRREGRLDPIFDGIGLTAFWRASGPPDPA